MNRNEQKKSSRRGFLGAAAAIGLAGISGLKVNASENIPFASASDADEWFKKIRGKHKIVFDGPEHNEGMPLVSPRVFHITNTKSGVAAEDLGIVIVFRHNAMPLALENRIWEKYNLGEFFKINDPATNAPSKRNLYWKTGKDLPIPGMAIDEQMNTGTLFCVCEMAIFHYSGIVAKKLGLDHETVRKDWTAGILPGIQPQPSGVQAVNRAQEHGCSYCFTG
jgi:hypothetical protein